MRVQKTVHFFVVSHLFIASCQLFEKFLKAQSGLVNLLRPLDPNETVMPRFVNYASDRDFTLRIAHDEAVFPWIENEPREFVGFVEVVGRLAVVRKPVPAHYVDKALLTIPRSLP